jgi:lipopolysaccharide transport system permease protein
MPEVVISTRPSRLAEHLNPVALVRRLWQHRNLIAQFVARDVQGRYRGSVLGLFWSFLSPLILLAVYTFVFGVVFKARWLASRQPTSLGEFALVLFCGLVPFTLFSECMGRASTIVVAVPNYVRKVVFPLEILPVSVVGSALFHALVSLAVLVAANLLLRGSVPSTLALVPLIVMPLVLLALGVTWFLASLGVFVRDVQYVIALGLQILLFLTPIFYPVEAVPPSLQVLLQCNPLAPVVENFRRVVLWGQAPDWQPLASWTLACGAATVLGYGWFMKTKRAFADVL